MAISDVRPCGVDFDHVLAALAPNGGGFGRGCAPPDGEPGGWEPRRMFQQFRLPKSG